MPLGVSGMQNYLEVEAIAIEEAKKYECADGRKSVSVEEEDCGWDLTSLHGGDSPDPSRSRPGRASEMSPSHPTNGSRLSSLATSIGAMLTASTARRSGNST